MQRFMYMSIAAAVVTLPASMASAANVAPDVIFGSGNVNGAYTVTQANGIEIGLRGKLRFNELGLSESSFNYDGTDTYSFQAGVGTNQSFPTPVWSFEWSINTDWDGSTGYDLADLYYQLQLDGDPASGVTSYYSFDPVHVFYADHSIGTNTTGNGGGTEAPENDTAAYGSLIDNNSVAQNSWRYSWFMFGPLANFDPTAPGEYTISLAAFNSAPNIDPNAVELARSTINIEVSAVPLPASALLMLSAIGGLGLLGFTTRRAARPA